MLASPWALRGTPEGSLIETWNQSSLLFAPLPAFPKGCLQLASLKIPLAHRSTPNTIPRGQLQAFCSAHTCNQTFVLPLTNPAVNTFQTVASLLLFISALQKSSSQFLLSCFNIFSFLYVHLCCIGSLIKHLHLRISQSIQKWAREQHNPLISQKETEAQHLAVGQTPCCTCVYSGRSVFSRGRLLPRGQWEGMEGWTVDLRGRLGHHPRPSVPALQVEWSKCLLTGSNTQLFCDLPLGQPHTNIHTIVEEEHTEHLAQHAHLLIFFL